MLEKRIEIRWRDMDAFGHVNNAVFLTYLEEVRDEWLERTLAGAGDTWEFVLARVAIDYRGQLSQADGHVIARCRLARLGRSSVHTTEDIQTGDGTPAAQAESVMVAIDRATGASRALTEAERAVLQRELDAPS